MIFIITVCYLRTLLFPVDKEEWLIFHEPGDETKLLEEISSNIAVERLRDVHPDHRLPQIQDPGQRHSNSTSPRSNGSYLDIIITEK